MIAKYYTIKALTNLHVGSGDNNYGVIDKQIQRDVTSDIPSIHGSSLKGAIREFFRYKAEEAKGSERPVITEEQVNEIFGDEGKSASFRFLSADLLAIPLRSNLNPYYLATAPMVINKLRSDLTMCSEIIFDNPIPPVSDGSPVIYNNKDIEENLQIEDFETFTFASIPPSSYQKEVFPFIDKSKLFTLLSDNDFKRCCDNTHLPVIARNRVGENNNLWYEQLLPRESILGFTLLIEKEDDNFKIFHDLLTAENSTIHIGANATIGQGFCKISELNV